MCAVSENRSELVQWAEADEVKGLGERFRATVPNAASLSPQQAAALAQYSIVADANPFRGEVYAYNDRGRFQLVEGYKLLVRWARRIEDYSETYRQIAADDPELPQGAIGFRCYILRAGNRPLLTELLRDGVKVDEALDLAATSAVGIVTKADRTTKDGRPNSPPAGWTWEQVARKRALKTALNMAYGMPSPRELASIETEEGIEKVDWREVPEGVDPDVALEMAAQNARQRARLVERASLTDEEREARDERNHELMYGNEDAQNWDAPKPKAEPPKDGEQPPKADKGVGYAKRPLTPAQVRDGIAKKVARTPVAQHRATASPSQQGLVASKLEECWPGDDGADQKRHSVLGYLVNKTSVNDLTMAEASALLDWLLDPTADPGTFDLHPAAPQEAEAILQLTLVEAGQGELLL